jgi:erythronate-4-phosphate dehydrogenase
LGIGYFVNDPPLQAGGARVEVDFAPLDEIQRCPVISLHVPLTRGGAHPTCHLVDAKFLGGLAPGTLLINTSRGAVVDNAALTEHLRQGRLRAVLDVWENEPAIHAGLLERVALGTAHIAGYSIEGRLNGTQRMHEAVCAFVGTRPRWRPALSPLTPPLVTALRGFAALRDLVSRAYNIRHDDAALRALLPLPAAQRATGFDRLRRDYASRREFGAWCCRLDQASDDLLRTQLAGLGFRLDSAPQAHEPPFGEMP